MSEFNDCVISLDERNIDYTVSHHKFIAILFYKSKFSERCYEINTQYEFAARFLGSDGSPVILAKVDLSEEINRYTALRFKISRVPIIKLFKDGEEVQDYRGPDDATEIAKYLQWGYDFCLGESSVSGPVIKLFNPFDDSFVDIKTLDVDTLVELVEEDTSTSELTLYGDYPLGFIENFLSDSGKDKAILFINFKDEGATDLESEYREAAKKFKGQDLIFMLGNFEACERLSWFFMLTTNRDPLIVIKNYRGDLYAKGHLKLDGIETWVEDYMDGIVTVHGESEPIPPNTDGLVKDVVASNFWREVMECGKNVVLMLYRPEVENETNVVSILEEVAKMLDQNEDGGDDVVFAKLNESANDIRTWNHDDLSTYGGSPTIFLIPSRGPIVDYQYHYDDIDINCIYDLIRDYWFDPAKKA